MLKRLCGFVTIAGFALSVDSAGAKSFCRPRLELHPFRPVSGVFPQERLWKADLTGYALRCMEASGLFQLQITRLKDDAPDLDFLVTEHWRAGRFEVVLTLAPDEAIGLAQTMWISRCTCTPRAALSGQSDDNAVELK
jgi:hypothetical protein